MVEGARLEIVYAGNRIEGSNPSFSATKAARVCGLFSYLLILVFEMLKNGKNSSFRKKLIYEKDVF